MPEPRLFSGCPPVADLSRQALQGSADVGSASSSLGPVGRARAGLRALEALDRITGQDAEPLAADLAALRGWAGWGPMAPAFAAGRLGAWKEIGERLEWLLPPDQLREAEQATPNAFYTPPAVAGACWQILRDLGFEGGRILEPGCGAGAFITATPGDVEATWVGVERDPPGDAEDVSAAPTSIPDTPASPDGKAAQPAERPPITHPVRAARLDGEAEPLFLIPAAGPEGPPTRRAPRARRTARSRRAARVAADDGAAQLALFDLPPMPSPAPTRRPAPAQNRPLASRK
jgi:hypothetical protein